MKYTCVVSFADLQLHAELPSDLEQILQTLPSELRDATRNSVRRALSDVDWRSFKSDVDPPRLRSFRQDTVTGRGRDWWVLPKPTTEALIHGLSVLLGDVSDGTVNWPLLAAAAVAQACFMIYTRTKITRDQALVLRALCQAHKGTGWTAARLVDEIPGSDLGEAEITSIIKELRSARTIQGEKPPWSIEENPQLPGHYWTLNV